MVDATAGLLGIEWIDGKSVKSLLPGGVVEEISEDAISESLARTDQNPLNEYGISLGAVDLSHRQRLPHSPSQIHL